MKFKRLVCAALSFSVAAAALSGCTGGKTGKKEDPSKVPEEPYEITWYTRASAQSGVKEVEAKVNEFLKDKINATLKFNILDAAQYAKKMSTMTAAGESYDIAFYSAGLTDYEGDIRSDALFDMAPYVDEYMPKLKELFEKDFFEAAYVDGKLGAVPILKENSSQYGWIYRRDIAEKYGIDMTKMKNLDLLEPYLEKIKAGEPEMEYPIEWDSASSPHNLLAYMMPGPDCVCYLDENGVPRDKIEIFPETKEFRELCEDTRRYYLKGLVKKDVLTASNAQERFKAGKAFCIIANLKPGGCYEQFPDMKDTIAQAGFGPITQNTPLASMLGVSSTCKNPYRVMRFLELLYTEPELANLMIYGIEGRDYTKLDGETVRVSENPQYNLTANQWQMGNVFLNYYQENEDHQKKEKYLEYNKQGVPNVLNRFHPNIDDFELEKIAVDAVKAQYRSQATVGALDTDQILSEYVSKLKEAGIEKVIEGLQKQYDELRKAQ